MRFVGWIYDWNTNKFDKVFMPKRVGRGRFKKEKHLAGSFIAFTKRINLFACYVISVLDPLSFFLYTLHYCSFLHAVTTQYISLYNYIHVRSWNNLFIIICWCVLRRMCTFTIRDLYSFDSTTPYILCVFVPILKYVYYPVHRTLHYIWTNENNQPIIWQCGTYVWGCFVRESSSKHQQPTAVRYR